MMAPCFEPNSLGTTDSSLCSNVSTIGKHETHKRAATQTPLKAIKVKNIGNNDLRVAEVLAAGRLGDKLGYAGFGNVAALADRMAALER